MLRKALISVASIVITVAVWAAILRGTLLAAATTTLI
jgi:hypothetical protein